MNNSTFKNRLQIFEYTLSTSEKKIADYVLNHVESVPFEFISDLSTKIGTSTSTITRFCKKLDYSSYVEFQTLLKTESLNVTNYDTIAEKVIEYYQLTLKLSESIFQKISPEVLVNDIEASNKIVILGIGSSGLTATEFSLRLNRMGINSNAVTDSYSMFAQSVLLNSKDLIIAISSSGETPEIIKTCNEAKKNNVKITALTKKFNSSISKTTDNIFYTSDSDLLEDDKFHNDQLSFLFFIDVITYHLLKNNKYSENYKKVLQVWKEK
ncbi:MurR/RpiR family transcriptional regulator [Peribacillus psychrosaccharolyticus]|uniref:MurR/RpiR family transcriptional regulator n=2 Tax=Peribacillus psychrosaccharolyticus TaxID=1407 RepID=A0A974NN05_PERPY|nr:MurR/RpiR family transcriptional regulator [Peribacillus psychrosaccharolyticus]MEC2056181.1 MurR/RpiR family transcriptional regulator [Peribacillus psychrosaccharolyticus]MED3743585.1 MurR/RpiR family transcriptional regulator [Peribacillus psychrosaccharolyticus]QQT00630.1 MurR/RpiR family transcriptional regulator [Peribacillus psychrosaccharolyticus]